MQLNRYSSNFFDAACIVPVRARPELLAQAVISILKGSTLPREIILVLDGTEEERAADQNGVKQITHRAEAASVRLRVLETPAVGPATARNTAVRATEMPWLTFLDSDDLWETRKLEMQSAYMRKRPHLLACQTGESWMKNDKPVHRPRKLTPHTGRFLRDAVHSCLLSLSAFMIRRDAFLDVGMFDSDFALCEDFDFSLRFLRSHAIGYLEEDLVEKRSGSWKQLSQTPAIDAYRVRALCKLLGDHGRAGEGPGSIAERERSEAIRSLTHKVAILEKGQEKFGQSAFVQNAIREGRAVLSLFSDDR